MTSTSRAVSSARIGRPGPVLGGAGGGPPGDQVLDPLCQGGIGPAVEPRRWIGLQEADQGAAGQQLRLGGHPFGRCSGFQPSRQGEQLGIGLGRVEVVFQRARGNPPRVGRARPARRPPVPARHRACPKRLRAGRSPRRSRPAADGSATPAAPTAMLPAATASPGRGRARRCPGSWTSSRRPCSGNRCASNSWRSRCGRRIRPGPFRFRGGGRPGRCRRRGCRSGCPESARSSPNIRCASPDGRSRTGFPRPARPAWRVSTARSRRDGVCRARPQPERRRSCRPASAGTGCRTRCRPGCRTAHGPRLHRPRRRAPAARSWR